MDYNLWQQLINSNIGQRATLPIQYLFGDRDKAEQFWNEDMGRFGDLLLSTTKPFRTGANILAQNWGSALTGKDMSQSENQGGFLKWLAGGITPEEQQVINDKPYLSALKSGAGMASTLAPFGTQGLRAAQFASNPLTNRLAQLASQGALEGGLGGFGYSREGKEVQDTLTGAGMGAGGELLMDYLTNPQFRKMITEASTYVDPSTGSRMYRGALGNDDDILFSNDLSKVPETPKDLGADIENLAEFTDSNNPDSGMDLRNIDLKDTKYPPVDIPDDIEITNYQDYDNPLAKLESEAKKYKTPEEFVKAQFNKKPEYGMSHRPTWEGMPTASDLLEGETLPRDVYEHPEWSIASGRNFKTDKAAQESWSALQKIRNKPDAEITVYRATRKKELNPGDWITFSKEYAKDSVEGAAEKVYDFKVKARDVLFAGDDINEFGYYPRSRFEEIWKRAWNLKDSAKELRGGFKEILKKSGLK